MASFTMISGSVGLRSKCIHYEGPDGHDHPSLRGTVYVTVRQGDTDVTFHMTPEEAESLIIAVSQCLQDRDNVIAERDDDDGIDVAGMADVDPAFNGHDIGGEG